MNILTKMSALKLLFIFAIVFSLASIPGPLAGLLTPLLQLVRANPAPAQTWTPGGPASNTFLATQFSSESTEFTALLAQSIDFSDWPLTPAQIRCLNLGNPPNSTDCGPVPVNPANYYVTSPISEHDWFETEFNNANVFWGIPFQFGNSLKGVRIRQGIDHLVDRAAFASNDPNLGGSAVAIDNPVPPIDGLVSPIACGWDLFANATETGAGCAVGPTYTSGTTTVDTGGTAYHLAPACITSPCPGPTAWSPGPGSPDLCIAANHFIAAGVATGHNANCQLTGLNSTAVANPPTFFIRNDNFPRLDLGTSMAEDICYLLTGSITLGTSACAGTVAGTTSHGLNLLFAPISTAVSLIFTTPGSGATSPNLGWWIYTAGFSGGYPFDTPLYFLYNSLFVDAFGLPAGSPCATTTGTFSASNYMYICVPAYDSLSNQMEFAPCLSATGDPQPGQTSVTTFGHCSNGALSAVSAGYQAENLFGRMALTLPDYSEKDQFGYLSNYNVGAINSQGAGTPQFFTWLNAWLPSSAVRAGTGQLPQVIRQGFKQPTTSVNPYSATTFWDFFILGNVYDSLYAQNPYNSNQFFNWMTTSSNVICSSTTTPCTSTLLGYTPASGTTAVIRSFLRTDLKWHDGATLNAWDVRFSFLSLKATGSFQGSLLATLLDVHLLSTVEFDLDLNAFGPFTQLTIGGPTILPGHLWSSCGSSWNPAASPTDTTQLRCSSGSAISATMSGTKFDPVANGIFAGSGAWVCENTQPAGTAAAGLPLGQVGTGCSSSDTQAPPIDGTWTLTRNGCAVTTTGPSCATPGSFPYFRSSGALATWVWSGMKGNFLHDFIDFSSVAICFGKPSGTAGCAQWQSGIGNPADSAPSFPCITTHCVGIAQLSAVASLLSVSMVAVAPNAPGSASSWADFVGIATGPALSPSGDGVSSPVLYEGTVTLKPASVVGCATSYTNANPSAGGYDC